MSVLTFGRAVSAEAKGSQLHRLVTENLGEGIHIQIQKESSWWREKWTRTRDQTRQERQDSSPRLPGLEKGEAAPRPRGFPFPPRISLLVLQPSHWLWGWGKPCLLFSLTICPCIHNGELGGGMIPNPSSLTGGGNPPPRAKQDPSP